MNIHLPIGHVEIGPSGVCDQSFWRIRSPRIPPPCKFCGMMSDIKALCLSRSSDSGEALRVLRLFDDGGEVEDSMV